MTFNLRFLFVLLSISTLYTFSADSKAIDFFSFIPKSELEFQGDGGTEVSSEFEPSNSFWAKGIDEKDVFAAMLSHHSGKDKSWTIRIGRGGQIYSFVGPYGESVPPQHKPYEVKNALSPTSVWIDEVWQAVAVDSSRNNLEVMLKDPAKKATPDNKIPSMKYYIHQAGTYRKDTQNPKLTFYSPMMASFLSKEEKSVYTLNWGQQAHIPSIHKSSVLYYTKYRDCGDGVLEVTSLIYNYGDDLINYINNPWGGIRTSSLPQQWFVNKENELSLSTAKFGDRSSPMPNLSETGGYFFWSQNGKSLRRPSLSIVFGLDHHYKESGYEYLKLPTRLRFGTAGTSKIRDYSVLTVNQRLNLAKGQVFYNRYYFVTGFRDYLINKSKELLKFQDYGIIDLNTQKSPKSVYQINEKKIGQKALKGLKIGRSVTVYKWPVQGTKPLFLMRDKRSGQKIISTDPYVNAKTAPFVNPYKIGDSKYKKYQNCMVYRHYETTEYIQILGYVEDKYSELSSPNWLKILAIGR